MLISRPRVRFRLSSAKTVANCGPSVAFAHHLSPPRRVGTALGAAVCILLVASAAFAQPAQEPTIEAGFRLLYELKFEEARREFQAWQKVRPEDPLGPAAESASYLFEEFYRQGVLTSEFFLDDTKLLEGVEGKPNPKLKAAFAASNARAQELAKRRLKTKPEDTQALFVLSITTGMLANYAGVIEKRHFESLRLIRKAEAYAKQLLALKPDSQDAYVALGISNYVVGCLPGYKRFLLALGGIHGDKRQGMGQLEMAASSGRYLRPFAKILLALAALREKQTALARTQLEELVAEFPQNPLFARELRLLNKSSGSVSESR